MRPLMLALMVAAVVLACERNRPPIEEALYVTLLTEVALIQAVYNVTQDTVITSSIFESVLQEYEVDKWDFMKSHQMYQLDLKAQERRWRVVLDSVTAQSQRLMKP
jgi:hypothetical protein